MGLRLLGPNEESTGFHTVEGLAEDGTVVARWECDCDWCDMFRMMWSEFERYRRETEPPNLGWLESQKVT